MDSKRGDAIFALSVSPPLKYPSSKGVLKEYVPLTLKTADYAYSLFV